MSLISQRDRELAIKALESYLDTVTFLQENNENLIMEINALINWIKLEYQKNEN